MLRRGSKLVERQSRGRVTASVSLLKFALQFGETLASFFEAISLTLSTLSATLITIL